MAKSSKASSLSKPKFGSKAANAPDKDDPVAVKADPRIPPVNLTGAPRDMTDETAPPVMDDDSVGDLTVPGVWFVQLLGGPPVAVNPAEVVANDETSAWQEFCKVNNISGSDHDKKIYRLRDHEPRSDEPADAAV